MADRQQKGLLFIALFYCTKTNGMNKADKDKIKIQAIINHLIRKNKMNSKDNPFIGLSFTQLEEIAKTWQAAKKILQEKDREQAKEVKPK